ncbi:MAG: penicillin-binding protein 2 [Lachnospira sp.]|nr:penicillin-binding protein 2 [Lachnospira sp.]
MTGKRNRRKSAPPQQRRGVRKIRNRETNIISYVFVILFLVMIVYLGYFSVVVAPSIEDSVYNQRIEREPIIEVRRGTIYSSDGAVLAQTVLSDDGTEEVRQYPFGSLFAQTVGMARGGGSGLEGGADEYLTRSTSGVDVEDPMTGDIYEEQYGDSIYTTLDESIQQIAVKQMEDQKGAMVVMDVSTGKILAMVSNPSYDPNTASENMQDWLNLSSTDSVLINRATQGLYPPGSTFKMVTALAYLQQNPDTWQNFSYNCTGELTVDGATTVRCTHAHGKVNFEMAIADSCNCAFSLIGLSLDPTAYRNTVLSLGFNQDIDIGIENSTPTFLLDATSSKADVMRTSFGQGSTQITPLQNAMVAATIANGGVEMKPYLIDHVEDSDGNILETFSPEVYGTPMTADQAQLLGKFMRSVVTKGTGGGVNVQGYTCAVKTGSAQYDDSNPNAVRAWTIGFAPYENPQIAFAVVLEDNATESTPSVRVVRDFLYDYFSITG